MRRIEVQAFWFGVGLIVGFSGGACAAFGGGF